MGLSKSFWLAWLAGIAGLSCGANSAMSKYKINISVKKEAG